jgi:hypothetical protein
MRFLKFCINNKILIVVYPPHSTYSLQPLDIGLFGPISGYYSTLLGTWFHKTSGLSRFTKREFYSLFRAAFISAFTSNNIADAWQKAGLLPHNPEVVLCKVKKPKNDRPETRDSWASTASSLSAKHAYKPRQRLKNLVGTNPTQNVIALSDFITKLTAENAVLRAGLEGHKMAAQIERSRRKRGKGLFIQEELDEGEGKSKFYSPTKVDRKAEALRAKEVFQNDEKVRKAKERRDKKK